MKFSWSEIRILRVAAQGASRITVGFDVTVTVAFSNHQYERVERRRMVEKRWIKCMIVGFVLGDYVGLLLDSPSAGVDQRMPSRDSKHRGDRLQWEAVLLL